MSSMSVKNRKELTLRPRSFTNFLWWLLYVENDGDTIFIVVPYHTLVGVGCIGLDHSVFLDRALGRLKVGKLHVRYLKRLLTQGRLRLRLAYLLGLVKILVLNWL